MAEINSCEGDNLSIDYKLEWEIPSTRKQDEREMATQVAECIWKSTDYRFRRAMSTLYMLTDISIGLVASSHSKLWHINECIAVSPSNIVKPASQARTLMSSTVTTME